MTDENQYVALIKKILKEGVLRPTRTGTSSVSLFAPSPTQWDLTNHKFPLLTTKFVNLRPIFVELMWFLNGQTDVEVLRRHNCLIWNGNVPQNGDLGPIYGFQWRLFGAHYQGAKVDYTGQGYDQILSIISLLKHDPFSRRIILNAWNVGDLEQMALPPCHMCCQFYVDQPDHPDGGLLSCQVYQRSCDVGLGVPFNIASYALLTIMLAHVTGLRPKCLTHCMGDAHIYSNHIAGLKAQCERVPLECPTLCIKSGDNPDRVQRRRRPVKDMLEDLLQMSMDRFKVDYASHDAIRLPLAK